MPTLYRDCALLDLTAGRLLPEQSILVEDGRVRWIRPTDGSPPPAPEVEVVDAGGTTAVPGMVDAHSHLTMPGGSHWVERGFDPTENLLATAEHNARLLRQAGVRWARDVGAPMRDGRAVSLTVRDAWRGHREYPYVRAAGSWVGRAGALPSDLYVEVTDGDGLLAAALAQLDAGADLVKLYLDGPDREVSPFTVSEVRRVVEAVHARGRTVTAHSGLLPGARVGAEAGVDCLEHAFQLDQDVARLMAAGGTAMVSTLAVLESWQSFAATTLLPRFTSDDGRTAIAARRERAHDSVRLAHAAGVLIAAGTDFGGGSLRANQLAWEVQTLVAAGLPAADALAAATVNGGRLLGEPDAGVLREGGPADFVLVHGDPLSDPAALWRVWRTTW
ncbi:MAG TPA: amidohydrolase family protein [Mycobacteriales bacterium]|nr:amidohydrolase family protein [Mycobacteriales bacterium]